jgi:hypothetical protein
MFQSAEIGHLMGRPYFRKLIKIEITGHETVMPGRLIGSAGASPSRSAASLSYF